MCVVSARDSDIHSPICSRLDPELGPTGKVRKLGKIFANQKTTASEIGQHWRKAKVSGMVDSHIPC